MYESFNELIIRFYETGIIQKIVKDAKAFSFRDFKDSSDIKDKIVLTMDHLAPWFYIFLILLSINFTVFLIEIVLGKMKNCRNSEPRFKVNIIVVKEANLEY